MTAALAVLALGALWQFVQIGLAAASMSRDGLAEWNVGPRDSEPAFSDRTGRLRRAVDNHFEALILFTIAVVAIQLSGQTSGVTAALSWGWLAARVLYTPAYAFGWSPWRSVIYGVGAVATVALLLMALL